MNETTIIVAGDPEKERGQVCITSDTRPDPSHCWARASLHCFHFQNLNYFVRLESATACRHMAEAVMKLPRPPQRAIHWGWGKGWPGL